MTTHSSLSKKNSYGITAGKKTALDLLTNQVLDAEFEVDTQQAIVNSLAAKLSDTQATLAAADTARTKSLNNRNIADELVQNAATLRADSVIVATGVHAANINTDKIANGTKTLIDKLIYSAQVVNKLSTLILRQKALNPLISDDLVTRLIAAAKDANNAIALTLVALKFSFASQATNTESLAATTLVSTQAKHFADAVSGEQLQTLPSLLHKVYYESCLQYNLFYKELKIVTNQLNQAQVDLTTAQINLKSLQMGLAAANAAALAS